MQGRHQHSVTADENVIFDNSWILAHSVKVARNRASTDVDALTKNTITDIGKMIRLRARSENTTVHFNEVTYPNFTRLLKRLNVRSQPAEMSFGVKCDSCRLEFSSRGVGESLGASDRAAPLDVE